MRRSIAVLTSLLCAAMSVYAQKTPATTGTETGNDSSFTLVSLALNPMASIPLGEGAQYFNIGGTMGLSGEFPFYSAPFLYLKADLGYNFSTLYAPQTVSLISASAGAGIRFMPISWIAIKGFGTAGLCYGFVNGANGSGVSGCFSAGAGLDFGITPWLTVGAVASYTSYLGLFGGLQVGLSASFNILSSPAAVAPAQAVTPPVSPKPETLTAPPAQAAQPAASGGIEIDMIKFEDVFPILQKYYDDHPIGHAVIRNTSNAVASNISVSFLVKRYMDAAKTAKAFQGLNPGESQAVDLYALFTPDILSLTESSRASAEITIEYILAGQKKSESKTETLRINNRNALIWSDDRMAALFVTSKDPLVQLYCSKVLDVVNANKNNSLNGNLQVAMAIHDALCASGIKYMRDPETPYTDSSKRQTVTDYLRFPRQTLELLGGDCDDLSILYCALFESVGVETAFITVPGHIYMAASLNMDQDSARKAFPQYDDLIFQKDKVWIPIEVTQRGGAFLKAWQEGAREWRTNNANKTAALYPIHDAWKTYEPVWLPESNMSSFTMITPQQLTPLFVNELATYVRGEMGPQEAALLAQIAKAQQSPKTVNALGVLYARYGYMDKAENQFKSIVAKNEYAPALVNLGNIYFMSGNMEKALEFYDRAFKKAPNDAQVILCNARANHALENYYMAKKLYDQLKSIDPSLAARFAYLDLRGAEATRAADESGANREVIWSESAN
jgi:tetratricopeptide (TPR) repeat protein